ncbi:hypothetical protein JCM10207_002196 [Rhodosporidiobolus poonsookiae]
MSSSRHAPPAWTYAEFRAKVAALAGHLIAGLLEDAVPGEAAWAQLATADFRDHSWHRTFQAAIQNAIEQAIEHSHSLVTGNIGQIHPDWVRRSWRAELGLDDWSAHAVQLVNNYVAAVDALTQAFRDLAPRDPGAAWPARKARLVQAAEKLANEFKTGTKPGRRRADPPQPCWKMSYANLRILAGVWVDGHVSRSYLWAIIMMLRAASKGVSEGLYLSTDHIKRLEKDITKVINNGFNKYLKSRPAEEALGKAQFLPLSRRHGEWLA